MTRYEVWEGEGGCAMFPEQSPPPSDVIELGWTKTRVIEADTWEAAMTKHHELMGWEPYKPMEDGT